MALPDIIGVYKTLGHLVSFRIPDVMISTDDYNRFLDTLVASGSYPEAASLRVERRRPVDAYQAAIKSAQEMFCKPEAHHQRYLLRPDKGCGAWGPRHLVRERFVLSGDAKVSTPEYDLLGKVYLDDADKTPKFSQAVGLSEEDVRSAQLVFSTVLAEFQSELNGFPSRMLRSRVVKLVDDCLPVCYDADHRTQFVLHEHAKVIDLITCVFNSINDSVGIDTRPRTDRAYISVVSLPDIEKYREDVGHAFLCEIQETIDSLRGSLSYYNCIPDKDRKPADVARAVAACQRAFASIKRYEAGFAQVSSEAKDALDDIIANAQALLGVSGGNGSPHEISSARLEVELLAAQRAFYGALASFGTKFIARADGTSIVWYAGGAPRVIQTGLGDPTKLSLTFVDGNGLRLPDALGGSGARRGLQGWMYSTVDVAAAVQYAKAWIDAAGSAGEEVGGGSNAPA